MVVQHTEPLTFDEVQELQLISTSDIIQLDINQSTQLPPTSKHFTVIATSKQSISDYNSNTVSTGIG
jgi:hypothetical protein